MRTWYRKPQEVNSEKYKFSGPLFVTAGIQDALTPEDMYLILSDLKAFVSEKGTVDYLQVYESSDGLRVFLIDEGGEGPDNSHHTMLLADEY
ncbi:MAG: hypothetical protein KBG30_12250 [Bacteroidales bacterium]|nr:hypothetical protein [Bacteroidales bacterium]